MKKWLVLVAVFVSASSIFFSNATYAFFHHSKGRLKPIVSSNWLNANKNMKDLVIIDIRTPDEYAAGHIERSMKVPFEVPLSAWITGRNDLLLELPDPSDIYSTVSFAGIEKNSSVVIVSSVPTLPEPPYNLAGATRVAATLMYAGVKNVAILNGGYNKWISEGRPTTTVVPTIKTTNYTGKIMNNMFVSIDYIKNQIGKSLIIDSRDAKVYSGEVTEPWADKPGHIPSAKSLPAALLWNGDGTYKNTQTIKELAYNVIGKQENKEIILYCGVGGYASSWWYVLTQILGLKNVKIYDGSAQEWAKYLDMVLD